MLTKRLIAYGTLALGAVLIIIAWSFLISPLVLPYGSGDVNLIIRMVISVALGLFLGNRIVAWGSAWAEAWEERERRDRRANDRTTWSASDWADHENGSEQKPEKKNFWDRRWM